MSWKPPRCTPLKIMLQGTLHMQAQPNYLCSLHLHSRQLVHVCWSAGCLLKPSNCSRTNFGRLILQLPHLTAHTFACSVAHKQRCIELSISFMSCSSEAYSLSLWLPNYFSCSIACSRIESVLYSTSYLLFVNWSIKGEVRHCLRRFPRDVENIFLSP